MDLGDLWVVNAVASGIRNYVYRQDIVIYILNISFLGVVERERV